MTIVLTEADTCREYVTPRLLEAGWAVAPHAIGEQHTFADGRVIASMRSHKVEVMRLLGEIEALVNEVQV